jgi:hypothetical protein
LTRRGLAALGLFFGAGCVGILGLDEYEDAIAKLCKCNSPGQVPQSLPGDCEEILGGRLASATPETRESWLAFYADNCAGSCEHAQDCYLHEGTCSRKSCSDDEECCGADTGTVCDMGTQLCTTP